MAGDRDPDVAISINGVPIRLTAERWQHIIERHHNVSHLVSECLDSIGSPDLILRGHSGAAIAVKRFGTRHYLAVVYVESDLNDGFVLTAYVTDRIDRSAVIWQAN